MGHQWDQWRNQKVPGNKWKWTHKNQKPMGHSKTSHEKEVHSIIGLPQEDRKISNKQSNPKLERTKKTTNKAQQEWKKGNN